MMCVRCFQVGKCLVQVDALVVSRTALIKSLKWGTAARLARFATTTRAKIGATGFGPSNSDLSLFFPLDLVYRGGDRSPKEILIAY